LRERSTVQRTQAVQVVLGEGEPGILRFVLEAEGFHVVGQARGEAELRHVLSVTNPAVIVLDAGISAPAALEARRSSDGASVVVYWPTGVVAAVADERVDPASVFHDLGGAVRRAASRTAPHDDEILVRLPEAAPSAPVVPLRRGPLEASAPSRPRRHRVLVVAATWTIVLGASAAIGLTIPRAFERIERARPHAPSPTATAPARSIRGQTEQPSSARPGGPRGCTRAVPTGHRTERGTPDDPGRRCGSGAGLTKDKGSTGKRDEERGQGQGKGQGRQDDPHTGGDQTDKPGPNGNRPEHAEEPGPKPKNDSAKQRSSRD